MKKILLLPVIFLCACAAPSARKQLVVTAPPPAQKAARPAPAKKETRHLIIGKPMAEQRQCVAILKKHNPNLKLGLSHEKLVAIYYEEGLKENIRPDIAFAQSMLETGYFKFPGHGDVKIKQNNFCGLGAVGGGAAGASFPTVREGVRAQIQHLKAYASKEPPKEKIVDPRYHLVKQTKRWASCETWHDLTGKWATDPKYGEKIIAVYNRILEH
jgi:hypothetical protein